jgi:enolase
MRNSKIKSIKEQEILDSRGEPTIEVELETNLGVFRASVPSGASKGKYEAKELRDGGKRYCGKGVLKAIKSINEIIAPKLKGKDPTKQKEIDELMLELDGTKDKSNLGANAILAVSIAVCRAGAVVKNLPLYQHIYQLKEQKEISKRSFAPLTLPKPCFNVINGGVHAGNNLALQEFMVIPQEKSFSENLETGSEIYHFLKEVLRNEIGEQSINIGDEGGFAPPIEQTKQALNLIIKAVKKAGYQNKIKIGLDCAASQFYGDKKYQLEGAVFTKQGLLAFYQDLVENYPIIFLEDPFSEEDWQGFQETTKKLEQKIIIVGDDLLTTNIERIKKAKDKKACSGLILKPNQIGTVTETLEAAKLAKSFRWKIIVSHRSGDTCDDFISDLAVGIKADFIKSGAPARGERTAKYNRLLKIEEEMLAIIK